VTGASAGALNAVLLADGFARGGPEAARSLLEGFWMALADARNKRRRPRFRGVLRTFRFARSLHKSAVHDLAIRAMADFEIDPSTMEPLRSVIEYTIDFRSVAQAPFPCFINATGVRDFELRVFAGDEIGADALCASCCVPLLFEPVCVDGVPYWDGGFLGNPALFPVIQHCDPSDIVLVRTTPRRREPPETAGALLARIAELGFAAALVRERRAIDFVSEIVREAGSALRPGLREVRVHEVPPHPLLAETKEGSFDARESSLRRLRALGQEAAGAWLDEIGEPCP
jgi:NTE family protein